MKGLSLKVLIIIIFFNRLTYCFCGDIKQFNIASEEWKNYTSSDGKGLYWDIFRKVYEMEDIKLNIIIVPYARSMYLVKNHKADAWVAAYIDEEAFALYPKWHFDADIVSVIFKKQRFPDWNGINSLANKKVGWIREYDYHQYIDVKMNITEVNSRKSALGRLLKDRIDFFIDDFVDIHSILKNKKYLNKIGFDVSDFRIEKLLQMNLFLGFVNNKRGRLFRSLWDKNFPILLKNGTIKSLFDQYNETVFPFENSFR